jgi:hypothetical protein
MKIKTLHKTCKKCQSREIKKDGFKRLKQRYKCKNCGHVFQNRTRKKKLDIDKLWKEFSFWKQFYSELAEKYWVSIKTIQSKLDQYEFIPPQVKPQEIVLLMDTTYFGDFWIMAFKEAKGSKLIHYKIVKNENNIDYKNWVRELQEQWWIIKAIVCDGRRWVLTWFPDIPTQMCNFHQVAIIRRYITKKPILQPNKDLKWISQLLVHTDKETFSYYVELFWVIHKDFLNERVQNSKWKWYFIHKRTRSAYYSLKNNLKYLFTWYDYMWTVDIPNTTNGLEWLFWNIKPKVALHRGLKKERKMKLILTLLHGQI